MDIIHKEPVFVLTSDVDWASEYCIEDLLNIVASYEIIPTVFVTHRSKVLEDRANDGLVELGIHPNFLPGSTHGSDVPSIIDHMFELVPNAVSSRSHSFVDGSHIISALTEKGIRYDSNICLHFQENLGALHLWSGMIRLPVFWEDDVHWRPQYEWSFEKYENLFFSPGLKILNVHPFFFALNIPDYDFYMQVKSHISNIDSEETLKLRYSGHGGRDFTIEIIEAVLRRGHHFLTLSEVYQLFSEYSSRVGVL